MGAAFSHPFVGSDAVGFEAYPDRTGVLILNLI